MTTTSITIEKTSRSRVDTIQLGSLEFGKLISDHMAVAEYKSGQWQKPRIEPYGQISFTPAMMSLHYGQSVFEGMKAFRRHDGNVSIFRIEKHHQRFNKSLERMCMPPIPEELFHDLLHKLVETDQAWVPNEPGYSLYIRPLVFATELRLGVKVSDEYLLVIMTSPVGPYHSKPFRLKVEREFVRTAEGGTGYAKCAGNYGGAFYPMQIAKKQGFDQVLWTDYKTHEYIDEVGMMNVMFVINDTLVTPRLNTAILEGITRDSIITLAREAGIKVEEKRLSVSEIEEGIKSGAVTEAFGVGTAAVVAPIAVIHINGHDLSIPPPTSNSVQEKLKQELIEIRTGVKSDRHHWNHIVQVS